MSKNILKKLREDQAFEWVNYKSTYTEDMVELSDALEEAVTSASNTKFKFDDDSVLELEVIETGEAEYVEGGYVSSVVFKATLGEESCFLETGYEYYSYIGSEWDGKWTVVKPVEKTIIVYEAVNEELL